MNDFQPTVPMRDDTPFRGGALRGLPASVHPTAVVEAGAKLAEDVAIGPFCVVSANAVIGRGTVLENHVTITGDVRIGEQNRIFPNAVIGGEPQDVSYRGTPTRVEIGDRNIIREGVTINRATEKEEGVTSIGSGNFLMACSHVAHDCRIGDHCTLANGVLLGGHVRVHSRASLSGAVAVHHWATIGGCSFVAGLSRVLHDIPPFMLCEGLPARPTSTRRRRSWPPRIAMDARSPWGTWSGLIPPGEWPSSGAGGSWRSNRRGSRRLRFVRSTWASCST